MHHNCHANNRTRRTNRTEFGPSRSLVEESVDPASDSGLRLLLAGLVERHCFLGTAEWEAIGAHLLALAERDAWRVHRHAAEFTSAFVAAAIEVLRRHPQTVLSADSPWGMLVTRGRHAGEDAAGAEATCGLTNRDPRTHHVHFASLPLVVSLDGLVEGRAARTAS